MQTHEMLFDAHWHAFWVFGGVPGRGINDNMRFLAMAKNYVYEPEFRNPAAGWVEPLERHWFKPNGEGASREERARFPPPDAADAELP